MEDEELQHVVYSHKVIEFVTVANEFCTFLEGAAAVDKQTLVFTLQKIFPLLYLKVSVLPVVEPVYQEGNEKFVAEQDWDYIHDSIKNKLGSADEYLEVFDQKMHEMEGPVTGSISENCADIYQDVKDFLMLYRLGVEDLMNDGLWECRMNFEQYWGQKLVNALRAIHMVAVNPEALNEEDTEEEQELKDINTQAWLISKRMKDFQD